MEYLIKSSAIIGLFWLFYKILLEKDTFYQINRLFFIVGIFIALLIPLWYIPVIKTVILTDSPQWDLPVTNQNNIATTWTYKELIWVIYLIGLSVFILRYLISLGSLYVFIVRKKGKVIGKYRVIYTDKSILPFSFFNNIILPKNGFSTLENETIIAHEQVHLQQAHSVDLLLIGLLQSLQWFNPFVWLYGKSLRQNLEFIADDLSKNSIVTAKNYQYLLLKTATQKIPFARYTNFYNSFIKKRIIMMQQNQSNKAQKFKHLLILPLLGFFIVSFNKKEVINYVVSKPNDKVLLKTTGDENNLVLSIQKNTTDKELQEYQAKFKEAGIVFQYTHLKRNSKGEITGISLALENKANHQKTSKAVSNSDQPISPIVVGFVADHLFISQSGENNIMVFTTDTNGTLQESNQSNSNSTDKDKTIISTNASVQVIQDSNNESAHVLIVKNGKISPLKSIQDIDSDQVQRITVYKGKEALKRYGTKGENGVIEILTFNENKQEKTTKVPDDNTGYVTYKNKTYFFYVKKGKLEFYTKFGEQIHDKQLIQKLKQKL